jgi:peptidoglycan-N-acetylglucosamine deacetylase
MCMHPPEAHMARWLPSRLILASFALHGIVLLAWVVLPQAWPVLLALLVFNHAVITLCGLLPRCNWLGENLTRLPAAAAARGEVAITIDDGPDPLVTPAVLDLLDQYQARATFFCIGKRAMLEPQLCRDIVRRGHAIENHSQHHRHHFSLQGLYGLRQEVRLAQDTLRAITGQPPRFFRAPAGLRNPFLDPVLFHMGLHLASWTRRGFDTRTSDPETVLARLTKNLCAGDILLLHDGNAARTTTGEPIVLQVLPRLLAHLAAHKLHSVTLHNACL